MSQKNLITAPSALSTNALATNVLRAIVQRTHSMMQGSKKYSITDRERFGKSLYEMMMREFGRALKNFQ